MAGGWNSLTGALSCSGATGNTDPKNHPGWLRAGWTRKRNKAGYEGPRMEPGLDDDEE